MGKARGGKCTHTILSKRFLGLLPAISSTNQIITIYPMHFITFPLNKSNRKQEEKEKDEKGILNFLFESREATE